MKTISNDLAAHSHLVIREIEEGVQVLAQVVVEADDRLDDRDARTADIFSDVVQQRRTGMDGSNRQSFTATVPKYLATV